MKKVTLLREFRNHGWSTERAFIGIFSSMKNAQDFAKKYKKHINHDDFMYDQINYYIHEVE